MADIIRTEFPKLIEEPYFAFDEFSPLSESQKEFLTIFSKTIQPSPHSAGDEETDLSRATTLLRERVPQLFNTSRIEYAVILFPTVFYALDQIFEGFPWVEGSDLFYTEDFELTDHPIFEKYHLKPKSLSSNNIRIHSRSLFCFTSEPSQIESFNQYRSQYSGIVHGICDATSQAPASFPDLSSNPIDFVLLNLRPLFGATLCVGLLKVSTADLLAPLFYGGGAVSFSCARAFYHRNFVDHAKRLENGTPSMINIFIGNEGINLFNKIRIAEYDFRQNFENLIPQLINEFLSVKDKSSNQLFQVKQISFKTIQVESLIHPIEELNEKLKSAGIYGSLKKGFLYFTLGIPSSQLQIEKLHQSLSQLFQ